MRACVCGGCGLQHDIARRLSSISTAGFSFLTISTCPNLENMDEPTKPYQPLARADFQLTFWKEQPRAVFSLAGFLFTLR